jgi:hypothetical protein
MCKQARSFLLVSIMFVVAISKIPSQVVEEVTTLVMMMVVVMLVMMLVMMVVVMLVMMYITIPSSHLPIRELPKMPSTLTNWFPVQAKTFIPKSYTQVSVFFSWQMFFAQLD